MRANMPHTFVLFRRRRADTPPSMDAAGSHGRTPHVADRQVRHIRHMPALRQNLTNQASLSEVAALRRPDQGTDWPVT